MLKGLKVQFMGFEFVFWPGNLLRVGGLTEIWNRCLHKGEIWLFVVFRIVRILVITNEQ